MGNNTIVEILAFTAIVISLLLSLFLLTVKTNNTKINKTLAAFLIVSSIDIVGVFLIEIPNLLMFLRPFSFLIFPIFYLFVMTICYNNFNFKTVTLLHGLPFFIYFIIIILSLFVEIESKMNFYFYKIDWFINAILLKLQAIIYVFTSMFVLKRYRKIFLEYYSSGNINIYKFLFQVVILLIICLPLTIAKEFVIFSDIKLVFEWINIILVLIALSMFSWFLFIALYNPNLFRGVDSTLKIGECLLSEIKKDKNYISNGQYGVATEKIEQIKKYIEENEPYIDSDFNLQKMSEQIKIPIRELSLIINHHFRQHFFDFINEYRIKKAIELLNNCSKNKYTIQQIFYSVGFNSKSSFNTAFKKFTSKTPTEYRKHQNNN